MALTVEIIAIGDEILNGTVVDTNSAWLGQQCQRLGVAIRRRQTVADNLDDMAAAMQLSAQQADLIVCCGGLGPTVDDITAEAVALFSGDPLTCNTDALSQITAYRAKAGRRLGEIDDRQAFIPSRAEVLANPVGTAPGFLIKMGQSTMICLPGVPREWQVMCREYVLPWIQERVGTVPFEHTWKFFGLTESQLAMAVNLMSTQELELHYRAHFPEIHLRVVTHNRVRLESFSQELMAQQGERCFSESGSDFAEEVNRALLERGWTLATAESCTGGLISQMMTAIPGASKVFVMGVVSYANSAKEDLGVTPELIAEHGAVSEPVVVAMAQAARERSGATLAVAVSGIAGPGGGTREKPVGTVHLALATPKGCIHKKRFFPFDRERIRKVTAYLALELVRRMCVGTLSAPVTRSPK
jgi:nicotinamide-nucleotide amidase